MIDEILSQTEPPELTQIRLACEGCMYVEKFS
jgi:hypothetical protein